MDGVEGSPRILWLRGKLLLPSINSSHIWKETPRSDLRSSTAPLMTESLNSLSISWGLYYINSQNSVLKP
ncbi:hypothetical protein LB505_014426 [Fusarium chuoi]|nr:hypothetical protein LB505_014426 [Fusarium chuoi]